MVKAEAWYDGASKGNPGPSGAGFRIKSDHKGVCKGYVYTGHNTNNFAEYTGLLGVLRFAKDIEGLTELYVRGDSKLVTEQIKGAWQCRSDTLRPLYLEALDRIKALEADGVKFTIEWIPRAQNAEADRLANRAVETMRSVLIQPEGIKCYREASAASA